jgi:hypothetical protein
VAITGPLWSTRQVPGRRARGIGWGRQAMTPKGGVVDAGLGRRGVELPRPKTLGGVHGTTWRPV